MTLTYEDDEERAVAKAAAAEAVEAHRLAKAAEAERKRKIDLARTKLGSVGESVEIFGAQQNSDLTEGKGHYITRGYFFLREDAEEASALLDGVMGTPNQAPVTELLVYTNVPSWLNKVATDNANRRNYTPIRSRS